SECLERMVLLGEPHLRAAVRAFIDHYHEERPHQRLDNALIAPATTVIGTGPITCRQRLGGLLKFYDPQAAYVPEPSFCIRRDREHAADEPDCGRSRKRGRIDRPRDRRHRARMLSTSAPSEPDVCVGLVRYGRLKIS